MDTCGPGRSLRPDWENKWRDEWLRLGPHMLKEFSMLFAGFAIEHAQNSAAALRLPGKW